MQVPTSKTPIARCGQLALYSGQMLSKFPQNPNLQTLSIRMDSAGVVLDDVQAKYVSSVKVIVRARVDVRFADWSADNIIRMAQRAAEIADGKVGGVRASRLFPGGITPIVRPVGATQVQEMRDLENRYEVLTATWPEAAAEKDKIAAARKGYEDALNARRDALQNAGNARTARDLAKEDFLGVYAEIAARVKAEFPRDRKMQDLFFDDVTVVGQDTPADEPSAEAPPAGSNDAENSG
ncbi:MAG: hypothetical protein ABI134_27705 [Byssovorax sp.]